MMWMKYFNRLLYALVAALGILIVYNLTDSAVKSRELTKLAAEALAAEDYAYFVSVRFYGMEPIEDVVVDEGDASYRVLVYDAAYVLSVDDALEVVDGIVWLMVQTDGTPLDSYFDIRYRSGDETCATQLGFRLFDFPVFSGMDQESTATLVKKDDLFAAGPGAITSIELWVEDARRLSVPVSIETSDFATGAALEAYLADHGTVPDASFGSVAMAPVVVIDSSGPAVRNILIYVAVVAVVTYLLFKVREKRLGKNPPTPGVARDIEALHRKEGERQ